MTDEPLLPCPDDMPEMNVRLHHPVRGCMVSIVQPARVEASPNQWLLCYENEGHYFARPHDIGWGFCPEEPLRPAPDEVPRNGHVFYHVHRGFSVVVVRPVRVEVSPNQWLVIYSHDGERWARPVRDFLSRFTRDPPGAP